MPKMTATEISRNFASVLDRVQAGEELQITRHGMVVAVIRPPKYRLLSAERFRECMTSAPPVDESLARDVRDIRACVGPAPA